MEFEGVELAVLRELDAAGGLRHVRELAIEYNHHISKDTDELSQILLLLEEPEFGWLAPQRLIQESATQYGFTGASR